MIKYLKRTASIELRKYLKYDKNGFATIYNHKDGLKLFRKMQILGGTCTAANLYLLASEYNQDFFNKASKFGFAIIGSFGLCFLGFLAIFGKRTVKSLRWNLQRKQIEIEFYNFFGRPYKEIYSTTELGNLSLTRTGYSVFDATKKGKIFIHMEENELAYYDGMNELISDIVGGQTTIFDEVDKKLKKYK